MSTTAHPSGDGSMHPDRARNSEREMLEVSVIAEFRAGTLSHLQASEQLGLSRIELDCLLAERKIIDHAKDVEDVAEELEAARAIKSIGFVR